MPLKTGGSAGRPSKLTPQVQERLLHAVRLGLDKTLCCKYAGISVESLRQWQLRGERGHAKDAPYVEFLAAFTRAEAETAARWAAVIEKAVVGDAKANVPPDWRAAAWKLERRYPAAFGKSAVEVTGAEGGPLEIVIVEEQRQREDADSE